MNQPNLEVCEDRGKISIGLRGLSVTMAIIAIAALATTVVVASVRNADTLSVVALALAIIAFVVQIILYIVQQAAASSQGDRAADIYAQTARALASIEEKAEGTKQALGQMNDRLLTAALTKATAEAAASTSGPFENPEVIEQVVTRAREIVENSNAQRFAKQREDAKPRKQRPTFLARTRLSRESHNNAVEVLKGLSQLELSALRNLARDLAASQRSENPDAAGLSTVNESKKLYEKGLVARVRPSWSNAPVFRLTPLGQDVAFLLMSEFANVSDPVVEASREKLRAWDKKVTAFRQNLRSQDEAIPVEESD